MLAESVSAVWSEPPTVPPPPDLPPDDDGEEIYDTADQDHGDGGVDDEIYDTAEPDGSVAVSMFQMRNMYMYRM